jgi:hypothetical protein
LKIGKAVLYVKGILTAGLITQYSDQLGGSFSHPNETMMMLIFSWVTRWISAPIRGVVFFTLSSSKQDRKKVGI